MNIKKLFTMSLISSLLFSCIFLTKANAVTQSQLDNFKIRVHYTSSSVVVQAHSGYSIYVDNAYLTSNFTDGAKFTIRKNVGSLSIINSEGTVLKTGTTVEFRKNDYEVRYLEIEGLTHPLYPDNLLFKQDSNGTYINCINVTNIETYLKGVLPYEMGSNAPLEALKAQAVAARTSAITRIGEHSIDGYDVTNTTADQAYYGYSANDFAYGSKVYSAVDDTKHIVLKSGTSLVSGLFYDNNGGYTADDKDVWSMGDEAYSTYKEDTYDTYLHSTGVGWDKINYTVQYAKQDLLNQIRQSYIDRPGYFKGGYCSPAFAGLSDNFDIQITSTVHGYVTESIVSDDAGHKYTFRNYSNKWLYGLRSQKFNLVKEYSLYAQNSSSTVKKDTIYVIDSSGNVVEKSNDNLFIKNSSTTKKLTPEKYTFTGSGYGHGVGMSQNGAMNRAEAGQSYEQILTFYYNGCIVADNYGN